MLLARHARVPFLELEDELTEFLQWATGSGKVQGRKNVCARVLDGAGGLGKTRLMIEVCARLSDEGWLAGVVAENLIGKGFETSESRLRSLIEEGIGARPLFLVVDYAGTRRADVDWFCKRLLRRRGKRGTPALLVLVSRAAGEWWTDLFSDPDIQKLFGRDNGEADVISLERLSAALTAGKRRELFDSSIHSLGTVLREAGRPIPVDAPMPQRHGVSIATASSALKVPLAYEQRFLATGRTDDNGPFVAGMSLAGFHTPHPVGYLNKGEGLGRF